MDFVLKKNPEIKLSPLPRRYDLYCRIPGSLDSLPSNKNELLKFIITKIISSGNIDKGYYRTLKILLERPDDIQYRKESSLISFFSSHYVLRDNNISSKIENNCDRPQMKDSPENIPFTQDYLNSSYNIRDNGEWTNLMINGLKRKCVFSVEHRKREDAPTIKCDKCNGSGFIKCPSCEGSGREQYVDGYFASGEERIKTGSCSTCGGTGRISCPDCAGSGRTEVFAPEYSILRTVNETISFRADSYYKLPFTRLSYLYSTPDELNLDYRGSDSNYQEAIIKETNTKGRIAFLKKNKKEFQEDNRKQIKEELDSFNLGDLYLDMDSRINGMGTKERGEVFCRKEIHYVFPVVALKVGSSSIQYSNSTFFIYEDEDNLIITANGIPMSSFKDSLSAKISSLIKK